VGHESHLHTAVLESATVRSAAHTNTLDMAHSDGAKYVEGHQHELAWGSILEGQTTAANHSERAQAYRLCELAEAKPSPM
jgi:hypothetical protein